MRQETAFNILKTGRNAFITGSAGTGKTFLINKYVKYLREHDIKPCIVAPTGIAASHIGGITIHSFFGLGIKEQLNDYELEDLVNREYLLERFAELKVLIVDEISMVSPLLFQTMDQILRTFKDNDKPFGGIQVVFSGDFFQLPPISKADTAKRYAFQTDLWGEADLKVCYLQKKYRQKDDALIKILDEIRGADVSEQTMAKLEDLCAEHYCEDEKIARLFTHNLDVDLINSRELDKLEHELKVFTSTNSGKVKDIERIFNTSFVLPELELKKQAVVIFIKNNSEKGYINGTLGEVVDFDKDSGYPIVKTFAGEEILAEPTQWEVENKNNEVVATVHQIPLKLAWALTVHKSQGMTLDGAMIDLSKTFEVGQGYVALSRVKSIAGLRLLGINNIALQVDPAVTRADEYMKKKSELSERQFSEISDKEKQNMFERFIIKNDGSLKPRKIKKKIKLGKNKGDTLHATQKLLEKKLPLKQIAEERDLALDTIYKHLEQIHEQNPDFDFSYLKPKKNIIEKVKKAKAEIEKRGSKADFSSFGKIRLKAIFKHLKEEIDYNEIKLSLLF